MKKLALFLLLLLSTTAYAATPPLTSAQLSPSPTNGQILQTDGFANHWVATSTLGFITGVSSVFGRTGAVVATLGDYTTSLVTEGTNLYFTNARAIGATLTGFSATSGSCVSTDTIEQCLQRLAGNGATYLTNITGLVTQGTNVTITGSGTSGSPYVINSSGSGGGSGNVSTSTHETAASLAYWTSNSGTPALLGQTSTSSIALGTSLTTTGGSLGFQVGGSNVTINTIQDIRTTASPSFTGLTVSGLGLGTINSTSGGLLYSTATTSQTLGSGLSSTGTLGALIGGTSGTLSVAGLTTSNFTSANVSQWTNDAGYLTSAITSLGPVGNLQTGPAITIATTSIVFNGLTLGTNVQGSGNTLTWKPVLTGTLAATGGGTSQATYTTGDMLYSSATNVLSKLGIGTAGFVLASVNGIPGWVATTTYSGGLAYSAGNVTNTGVLSLGNGTGTTCSGTSPGTCNVNTTQNITTLSNLTVAGFVQTTSAGLLSSAALTSGQVTTALGFTPGQGTVTAIGVTTNQGVSGASSGGATPNLTISLGALTGVTSFNGLVVTANTGVITTGTWNGTTIAIARGGTNQTSFNTNSIPYFDGTSLNSSTDFLWQPTGDWFTLGTTTASRSLATLATSTAPQLLLTDGVSTPFTFRAVGNDFFMSTSSPTTFATSSISLLSIVPSPTDNATTTWSSMDFLIKQTSQVAFGIFDLFGTQVLNVNTASTTGSIFTVAATTSPSVFNPIKLFDVDQYGGITASSTGATPTVVCTPSGGTLSVSSNDSAGTITAGTLSTACTVTFAHTKLSAPVVQATGSTVFAGVTAQSTTAFTVSMAATTGDTINYWVIQP